MVFLPLIGGEGTKNPAKRERRKRSGNVEGRSLKRDRSQPLIALRVSPSLSQFSIHTLDTLTPHSPCADHATVANTPTRQQRHVRQSDHYYVHYCTFWNITTRTSIISRSVHKLTHDQRTGWRHGKGPSPKSNAKYKYILVGILHSTRLILPRPKPTPIHTTDLIFNPILPAVLLILRTSGAKGHQTESWWLFKWGKLQI